jgi:hypothetical protein
MTRQTAIILEMKGDYFDTLGRSNMYERWLTDQGVPFTFVLDSINKLPMAVLIPTKDATAFKLKFRV